MKIIETYVIDPHRTLPPDFYGKSLYLALCAYLREEKKFGGIEELVSQIKSDVSTADGFLEESTSLATSKSQLAAEKLNAFYEIAKKGDISKTFIVE